MDQLSSRERLLRTLDGEPIDRVATFDIIHNIDLIERLTGEKVTPRNAEDLFCRGIARVLDLVRHFAVPNRTEPWTVRDENGFVYRYEWWTGHLIHRPEFRSTRDVADCVERDIELIYRDIEENRICHLARQHAMLFDENYDSFEELKAAYRRIAEKLEGTQLLPPEDVNAIAVATERYDETNWWYLYHDYPEIASTYLDALTDYQLHFIDRFADAGLCPLTQISVATGTGTSLLYSKDIVRREILPREQRKIERWKRHGYRVLAFLDGYKWPVIDDYLALGVEEIHPVEPYCGMDVKTLREKYPELPVGQPIDCAQLLAYGTPDQVRSAVVKAIEDAGARKIIIGSTSEVHPAVKVENALAMYDTARSYAL
jgi:hypothetical protein